MTSRRVGAAAFGVVGASMLAAARTQPNTFAYSARRATTLTSASSLAEMEVESEVKDEEEDVVESEIAQEKEEDGMEPLLDRES